MSVTRTLPALCVLALILLVGVPGQARASTVRCSLETAKLPSTCHIDMWARIDRSESLHHFFDPTITRGYYDNAGRPYPLQNGVSLFRVPHFAGVATSATLYYHQSAHQNSASLRVNYLYDAGALSWPADSVAMFWAAWNDTIIIATDVAHTTDGWYSVSLTSQGLQVIDNLGHDSEGGTLFTGWTYRGFDNGTYADVDGAGGNYEPYIDVEYQ
jgi:hypothetical protein